MKETDELRRVAAKTECANGRCEKLYLGDLERIADRIDAWIRLPLDADGVPIRIGDVMEWCDSGETLTVEGIGRDVLFYIDGENAEWTAARNKRHHHEPTVEDVLREFAEKIIDLQIPNVHPTYEEAIAEYAAKLRLAGDE